MKTRYIIAGLATLALIGFALQTRKRIKVERRLHDVADAGYETAHDVLYPLRGMRSRR